MRFYFAVLAVILAALPNAMGQAKGPAFYIENTTRSVGTVTQGVKIKQIFQFTNKGDRVLEILDVENS